MSKKNFAKKFKLFPSNRANNSGKPKIFTANKVIARDFFKLDQRKIENQVFRGQNETNIKLAETQAMKHTKWERDHCIFE